MRRYNGQENAAVCVIEAGNIVTGVMGRSPVAADAAVRRGRWYFEVEVRTNTLTRVLQPVCFEYIALVRRSSPWRRRPIALSQLGWRRRSSSLGLRACALAAVSVATPRCSVQRS